MTEPATQPATDRAGRLVTVDGQPVLRFERRYPQPIERVWRAVSDRTEMQHWFPADVVGERRVGAELRFEDEAQRTAATEDGEPTRADGPIFRGTVVVHDPPHVFSFTWGGELLRFELHPHDDGTRLVFTQVLSHTSVAARNGAGWDACLQELDARLDAAVDPGEGDWQAVYADYVDRIGPELGSPTPDGMVWERATHVDPARVRAATTDPGELAAWGGAGRAGEDVRWEIDPAEVGSRYRLVHRGIGSDAELASAWHALLLQLDMWLAAEQLVPADPAHWVAAYERVLGG